MAFKTKITRDPFTISPFTAEQMQGLGDFMCDVIIKRIKSAKNASDSESKPLVPRYEKRKLQRGLNPNRDWTWRGLTLRSLKTKSVSASQVTIGFVNDEADRIAHFNNLRERAFAVSPNDNKAKDAYVNGLLQQHKIVTFKQKKTA